MESLTDLKLETSIVIPAYNEAERIVPTLDRVVEAFRQEEPTWELLVVDDGSTDETCQVVREFSKRCPQLRLLRLTENQGKGGALRVGMTQARGRRILFTDADGATPIEEFERLAKHLANHDLVIGERKTDPSRIGQRQPKIREILGRGYTLLANLLLGLTTPDYTCGFKCFRRSAAHQLFRTMRIDGWSYDAELLYLAHRSKFRTKSIPVQWDDGPQSHVRLWRDIPGSFFALLVIRILDLTGRYQKGRPLPEFHE